MAASNDREQSSLSNYADVIVTHHDIKFVVDFGARLLRGSVDYHATRRRDGVTELVLDTNHLVIDSCIVDGAIVPHALDAAVEPFGRALRVPLPPGAAGAAVVVTVAFATTADGAALQFLTPAQTAGGRAPFLFTQCQAIHARSLLPCQDAPGVKSTFAAVVEVPRGLTAVMSAVPAGDEPTPAGDGGAASAFRFTQAVPIPSYLIALAVGELESRRVGPRSRVYAEPSVVDAAAWEFADTEAFVAGGEALMGPYVWGEYNVLVLPPSFPYGGMENPCITFVTPTLIAGDRSLVDVIAHEVAHSHTGNLVTNGTCNHFWLNEGWTMFAQRKILAAMHGAAAFDFDAVSGELALAESTRVFMERGQAEYTKLVPDLTGVDPDDSFSAVPYEKGFYLLAHLESLTGAPAFAAFMHDYVQTFKYKSLTSSDFAAYATAYFAEGRHALPRVSHAGPPAHTGAGGAHDPADIPALAAPRDGPWPVAAAGVDAAAAAAAAAAAGIALNVDWDAWFYGVGPPPVKNAYASEARAALDAHADAWVFGADAAAVAADGRALTAAWRAPQWIAFCERLTAVAAELSARSPPAVIAPAVLARIDAAYALSASRNAEIRCAWGALRVRSGVAAALPDVLALLREQGRMKYLRPLFRELLRSTLGREPALELWAEHGRGAYHPIAAKMVAVDIEKETARGPPVDASALVQVDGAADDAAAAGAPAPGAGGPPRALDADDDGAPVDDDDAAEAEEEDGAGSDGAPGGGDDDAEDDGDNDDEDEDDGADAPVVRLRFGARGAGRRQQRRREVGVLVPPTAPAAARAAAPPAASAASPADAAAVAAAAAPTGRPAAASSTLATTASTALPADVAEKRRQLLATAALRAAHPDLSPMAAARQAKGGQHAAPGAGDDGDEGGGGGGGGAGAGGRPSLLAGWAAALLRPLHAGVVTPATGAAISTALAVAVVGAAAAGVAYAIYRRAL